MFACMFHKLFRGALLAAAVSSVLWDVSPTHAQSIELSFSYWTHDKSAVGDSMKWWAKEVERRSDGDAKVNIFWSQALAKFQDNFAAVRDGQADIAELAAVFSMTETPAWALADTGAGPSDPYVGTKALENVLPDFPQFEKELAAAGMKYLWHYSWGGLVLMGNGKQILVPSDFSGQNVRVSSWLAEAIRSKNWNANPVQISIADMLQGLQRGTVDGGSNYWNGLPRFADVIDWLTVLDQGQKTAVVVMNQATWNALSDKAKKAIDDLRPLMMQRLAKSQIEEARKNAELLAAKGVKVTYLTAEQGAPWGEGMKESFDKRAAKLNAYFPDSQKFRDAFRHELENVRKEVKAQGYPWE